MRFVMIGTFLALAFSGQAAFAQDQRIENNSILDPQDYATKALEAEDWSSAERELLSLDVAEEDKVFAKLNLAFVYSTTGRREQAIALYTEVMAEKKNPYAMTTGGQPRRVKTIARQALAMLQADN